MRQNWTRLTLPVVAALGLALGGLAGCNTIEGFGQDVEAGGEVVQDAARETKRELQD